MKQRFACLFLCFVTVAAFAKRSDFIDNTFSCQIENHSAFVITVDEVSVASGAVQEHKFPLHDSPLYDGWDVTYTIPLTNSVQYMLTEKKSLADNQGVFFIDKPQGEHASECYVVFDNNSTDVIKLTKNVSNAILPCYESGTINGFDAGQKIYAIAGKKSAVYQLNPTDIIYVTNENTHKSLPLQVPHTKGFVYFFSYDNGRLILQDARPLQSIGEKLWVTEYDANVVVRDLVSYKDAVYVLGSEMLYDTKRNAYYSSFVQCVTHAGTELWRHSYGVKGADTLMYDAVVSADSLIVVGQTIQDDMSGFILQYDLQGNVKKTVSVPQTIGLDKIVARADGTFVASGYDHDEKPIEVLVAKNFSVSLKKPAATISHLVEDFVDAISATVADAKGNQFVAGESAAAERPVAVVGRVKASGGVDVLYTATEPFSYIADMKINRATEQLLLCGTLHAQDSFGNGGTPFVRCIDSNSGAIIWEHIGAPKKYEVAAKIIACADYGFITVLVNADADGGVTAPCALVRTNAVGKFDF